MVHFSFRFVLQILLHIVALLTWYVAYNFGYCALEGKFAALALIAGSAFFVGTYISAHLRVSVSRRVTFEAEGRYFAFGALMGVCLLAMELLLDVPPTWFSGSEIATAGQRLVLKGTILCILLFAFFAIEHQHAPHRHIA